MGLSWWQHPVNFRDSAWISAFLASCKDEHIGYSFLNRILETLAAESDGTSEPSAAFPLRHWARLTNCQHGRTKALLDKLPLLEGVTVEYEGSTIRVTVPKLLDWLTSDNRREKRRTYKKKEEGARRAPLPENFEVTPEMRNWAVREGISADIELETQKFREYHCAKGTRAVDWDAQWRSWMLKAKDFQPVVTDNADGARREKTRRQKLLEIARDFGLSQHPGESEDEFLARVDAWNNGRIEARRQEADGSAQPGGLS